MTYIVFEGMDGTGKSTQAALLLSELRRRGHDAILTAQPTDGPFGKFVRAVFERKVVDKLPSWRVMNHLFLADGEWHRERLENWLKAGKIVISDRSWLSGWVYQGISAGSDKFLARHLIEELNRHMPEPSIVFVLETSVQEALRRLDKSEDLYQKQEFMEQVAADYARIPRVARATVFQESNGVSEVHNKIITNDSLINLISHK